VRFFGNFSVLRHEMYEIGKTFTTLKFLHLFYEKIHRFVVHHILGRDVPARAPSLHAEFGEVWDERETSWAWIPTFLTLAIMWWILKWLYQKVMAVVRPGAAAAAAEAASMAQAFQAQPPPPNPNGPPPLGQQPSYGGGPYANGASYYDGNVLSASSLPPQLHLLQQRQRSQRVVATSPKLHLLQQRNVNCVWRCSLFFCLFSVSSFVAFCTGREKCVYIAVGTVFRKRKESALQRYTKKI